MGKNSGGKWSIMKYQSKTLIEMNHSTTFKKMCHSFFDVMIIYVLLKTVSLSACTSVP